MSVEAPAPLIAGQQDLEGREYRPPVAPDSLVLRGTVALGLHETGGKAPTSAFLQVPGVKVQLQHGTAYEKGDTVSVTVELVINDVRQKDQHDKATGIVLSCEQVHGARVVDIRDAG